MDYTASVTISRQSGISIRVLFNINDLSVSLKLCGLWTFNFVAYTYVFPRTSSYVFDFHIANTFMSFSSIFLLCDKFNVAWGHYNEIEISKEK